MWAFIQPINMFGMLVDNTQNFGASADRLFELQKAESKIKNPVSADGREAAAGSQELSGRVEFRNVSFAYNETPVIKDMSFVIEPGTTVGILGPTGSGKSTIANLMCRYYDADSGEVLIDGKNVKIKD